MFSFLPDLSDSQINTEIILLVDRSGSMGGQRIRDAAKTLKKVIECLPEEVYFNIMGTFHEMN